MVGIGVAAMVLGIVAITQVFTTVIVSGFLIGILMTGAGIAQALGAFGARGFSRKVLWLIVGVLYILAGTFLFSNPLLGSVLVTLLVAILLVGAGIARIVFGLRIRPSDGWGWMVASGLVTLAAGSLIASGWPDTFWVLGLVLGVDILSQGVAFVALGLAARRGRFG